MHTNYTIGKLSNFSRLFSFIQSIAAKRIMKKCANKANKFVRIDRYCPCSIVLTSGKTKRKNNFLWRIVTVITTYQKSTSKLYQSGNKVNASGILWEEWNLLH